MRRQKSRLFLLKSYFRMEQFSILKTTAGSRKLRQSKEYSKNVDISILQSKGYSTVHKFAKKKKKLKRRVFLLLIYSWLYVLMK